MSAICECETKHVLSEWQCHACRTVAAFVDIEAEASDDDDEEEDESGDNLDGEEEEGTEADAMFVTDDSPAGIRSQPERGYAKQCSVRYIALCDLCLCKLIMSWTPLIFYVFHFSTIEYERLGLVTVFWDVI